MIMGAPSTGHGRHEETAVSLAGGSKVTGTDFGSSGAARVSIS
jgi:hypothetical protein